MTVGNPASDPAFEPLRQFRPLLLKAHKILMDAEKDRYEASHGPIANKGDYLRLVLSDEQLGEIVSSLATKYCPSGEIRNRAYVKSSGVKRLGCVPSR